jgi:arginine decarboxylase
MSTTLVPPAARDSPTARIAAPAPSAVTPEAPYLDALRRYADRLPGRFHVPGHKGGAGAPALLAEAFGPALRLDVPSCIEGIDIGCGEQPLACAERLAAATWGARRTWFLVNGASEASHALCLALGPSGGDIVVQRNVHSSTIHGLVLAGARAAFVLPGLDADLGIAHCVGPRELAVALDATPAAAAAFVVSPTYFGAAADVAGLAEVCHERGVALVVDEAWGAHFRLHDRLPQDALAAGADVVISGTHKLVGSLTQSAMLHMGDACPAQLDEAAIGRALRLVRTTSPSSLLLGSLDAARAHVDRHGAQLVERALAQMDIVKRRLRDACGLAVLGDELVGRHAVAGFDPLRLAIDVRATGVDGHVIAADLLRRRDVNLELVTDRVLIAHVGVGEPVLANGARLVEALTTVLSRSHPAPAGASPPPPEACFGEPVLSPREAFFAPHEQVALHQAAGRVSADSIAAYPPGIANVLPGERFTQPLVDYLLEMTLRGRPLRGTWDERTAAVRVLSSQH